MNLKKFMLLSLLINIIFLTIIIIFCSYFIATKSTIAVCKNTTSLKTESKVPVKAKKNPSGKSNSSISSNTKNYEPTRITVEGSNNYNIIQEMVNSSSDGLFYHLVNNYLNPIDTAYMEYLNGKGISCEAALRAYQEEYLDAWKNEFYNVAVNIYHALKYKTDKKSFAAYIKSVDSIIVKKQKQELISIVTRNSLAKKDRLPGEIYGNGTHYALDQIAALIYREEALSLISDYNCYLESIADKSGKPATKYQYLTTKIEEGDCSSIKPPAYFK